MNRFQNLKLRINELLSSSYKFHKTDLGHDEEEYNGNHRYEFHTDKGNKYSVDIHHFHPEHEGGSHEAYVRFSDKHGSMEMNHSEKGSAHKVISTVTHIIKHHLANHPRIDPISFSGDQHHAPVYKAIAKKIAHTHHQSQEEGSDLTSFKVKASDLKK